MLTYPRYPSSKGSLISMRNATAFRGKEKGGFFLSIEDEEIYA